MKHLHRKIRQTVAAKPISFREFLTVFVATFLIVCLAISAGNKQCIAYFQSDFIGTWRPIAANNSGFKSLLFLPDSTAVFDSGSGAMVRYKFEVINNNLKLSDFNGKTINNNIAKLDNDTLGVIDLCGNGVLALFKKQPEPLQFQMTGIENRPNGKVNIFAYPNPFNSGFTIELPNKPGEFYALEMTGINGKMLLNQRAEGATKLEIIADNWPQGIYIVKVTSPDGERNYAKVIKVRY